MQITSLARPYTQSAKWGPRKPGWPVMRTRAMISPSRTASVCGFR
jgi:hypothetical protein